MRYPCTSLMKGRVSPCGVWPPREVYSMVSEAPLLFLRDSPHLTPAHALKPSMVVIKMVLCGVRDLCRCQVISACQRNCYFVAEQPVPAPHLASPEGRAALTHIRVLNIICAIAWFASSLCGPSSVKSASTNHSRGLLEVRDTHRLLGEPRALDVGLL